METTKLSSKGQVIIPKEVRARRCWKPGQAFDIVETDEGVLLRPHAPFPPTRLEEVGSFLRYQGQPVPLERLGIGGIAYEEPYSAPDQGSKEGEDDDCA